MTKRLNFLKLLMLLVLATSCTDDYFSPVEFALDTENTDEIKAVLVDGILHFKNKEDFKTSIGYMKSLSDEDVEVIMYKFYNDGFEPLYPFYREEDKVRIESFIDKKRQRLTPNNLQYRTDEEDDPDAYIEPDDDLIADDYFAGLLNFDREIVVDGKLHKYTNEGVFRVDLSLRTDLDNYIVDNDISELNFPNPDTIERGLVQVSPTIERYTKMLYQDPCDNYLAAPGFGDDILSDDCYSGGGGGGYTPPPPPPDHTESMKNYMKDLEPCDTQSGGLFGWNPFGTSRKCYSSHSDRHRVKTKYWNEDLLFYSSIGVKVKHQRKGLWWYAKTTDEVALTINQAIFTKTLPYQAPNYTSLFSTNTDNKLYYYDGKFYDNFNHSYAVGTGWTPTNDAIVPKTPFQEDIIILDYLDLPFLNNAINIEFEAEEINRMFWEQGVWNGAKTLMNRFNKEPKKLTYMLHTPQKIYINYVDLTQRKLNTKKIVNTLDYDWGGILSYKVKFKSSDHISTVDLDEWSNTDWDNYYDNPNQYNGITTSMKFQFADLTEFDTLLMDFVGMTRRGNGWKGSKIVYKKE